MRDMMCPPHDLNPSVPSLLPHLCPLPSPSPPPSEILVRLEKKDLAWERYYDMSSQELGELIRMPKYGKTLHKLIHQFPK